jgi:hypothetical protein
MFRDLLTKPELFSYVIGGGWFWSGGNDCQFASSEEVGWCQALSAFVWQ